ncbi:MAG: DUF3853 family protein [Bacteroidetes bacterium]|nr:DUF3853 family protein [Bacteroidota bacterium]
MKDPLLKMIREELRALIKEAVVEALREYDKEKQGNELLARTYKRSEIARLIHISPSTVTKLILDGKLETTRDGKLITGKSVNDYLRSR